MSRIEVLGVLYLEKMRRRSKNISGSWKLLPSCRQCKLGQNGTRLRLFVLHIVTSSARSVLIVPYILFNVALTTQTDHQQQQRAGGLGLYS